MIFSFGIIFKRNFSSSRSILTIICVLDIWYALFKASQIILVNLFSSSLMALTCATDPSKSVKIISLFALTIAIRRCSCYFLISKQLASPIALMSVR